MANPASVLQVLEMEEPNTLSFSSLLHTPLDTAEPPRKRPRIAEGEVNLAVTESTRGSSPGIKSSAASALASLPRSRIPASKSDVLHRGDVLMGDATPSAASSSRSARRPDTSNTESNSEAERSDVTLLEGLSLVAHTEGGDGDDVGGALQDMKVQRKGNAKATNEVQEKGTLPLSSSGTSTLASGALGSDGEGVVASESLQLNTNSDSFAGQVAAEGTSAHSAI